MKLLSVPKEKRLSKQAVITLVNHTIFQFGNSLSLIFINLYLWRLTESLVVNGLFNLTAILSQAIATLVIGKIAKQKGHLVIYRYGIFLTALFYLCIVVTQENMVHYFMWFALLRGISQATYWLSYFTLAHEVSSNQNRHRYLGWNQVLMGLANLVGPAVAGVVISWHTELTGYVIVFSVAFIMFIIATIGSVRIEKVETHHKEYYMKYIGQIIKKRKGFGRSLFGWFIIGFPQGILMYIPPILLFTIFPNESFIGYMNVLFLSLSILASYIISRIANLESTKRYLYISAIGMLVSSMFLLSEISIWTVVLFMAIQSLFKPLQANTYAVYYFQWLDFIPLKENFRVESVVLREALINLGRGLGIVLFMVFSTEINPETIPWILVFVMAIQILIPSLAKKHN
ncbi:MFS transporter [Halalkalibacter krulwichiae]|uniref:Major Facilitator Superfamily protein n=1 Tax=Halalkalibacter krulwichiae TaxID=199441 RepID=A0A1X9MDA7_9BACI|nr:MFS transporter [Halalkalibacter krulwichiae]ARK29541.1 Major Facilitator Superfamily protein [Halalkalibacter krulwichiae]